MKRILSSLVLMVYLFINPAFPQVVTSQIAQTFAINALSYESRIPYTTDSISAINTKTLNGNIVLFEVLFNNGTSVLLSGHKACTPILGMVMLEDDEPTIGLLNRIDSLPNALQDLLEYYSVHIDYYFSNSLPMSVYPEWDSLLTHTTILCQGVSITSTALQDVVQ